MASTDADLNIPRGHASRAPEFSAAADAPPRSWAVGVWVTVAAASVALYFINPSQAPLLPDCVLHSLTGLHCPGCGSTRAIHQLLHGHPATAFGLNPLAVLSIPFLIYAGLSYTRRAFTGVGLPGRALPGWASWTLLGVIVVYSVLRNIPAWPFTLLAPG